MTVRHKEKTIFRMPKRAIPALVLFGLALLLRGWRCLATHLSGDAAVTGLISYNILDGDFPIFFLGQKFMGTMDSYLSAPVYLLFGPSTLTVNFLPTLLALGTIWITYQTLRRVLGVHGSLVGLYSLAVPTALSLFSQTDGKSFYHLAIFLGAGLMWITLKLGEGKQHGGTLLSLAWGLIAGLAFWTNFLSSVIIGACLVYLAIVLKVKRGSQWLGIAMVGALGGSLPLLGFSFFREWPWLGTVAPGTSYTLSDRASLIFFNSLPVALGINPPDIYGLFPWSIGFIVFSILLLLLLWASIGMVFHGIKIPRREILLPLLVLVFNLGAALMGGRPNDYRGHNQRYLLPLYVALPFFWGYWSERFDHRKTAVIGFVLLWGGIQAAGYSTFQGHAPLLNIRSGDFFTKERQLKILINRYREEGFRHIYQDSDFALAFLSGGSPTFSSPIDYLDRKASARVGASLNPAYRMPLEANFRLLGLPHLLTNGIYHSFSDPLGAGRLPDRKKWKTNTLDGRPLGNVLQDGDLSTGFTTRGSNPEGQGFVVDLGREQIIGGLALIPQHFQEMPGGLKFETAGSQTPFRIVREVRNYTGPFYLSGPHPFLMVRYPRIECYFPPHPARYLRLTQLGEIRKDWPVKELLVFGAEEASQEMPWPEARSLLLKTVAAHPLNRLYADAWPSSLIYSTPLKTKPGVLLPNYHVDAYGSMTPSPHEPLVFDPSPGNGLLVLNREVPLVTARLKRSGIAYDKKDTGRYTLLKLLGRTYGPVLIPKRITSEVNPQEASELVRGISLGKRWSSGLPQKAGIGLTIDLGRIQPLEWVTLGCPRYPQDFPRRLRASYSLDEKRWTPVGLDLTEPLAFTGQVLLLFRGPTQRYRLDPAIQARFLRLELSESDPEYWWSVEALQIHGSMD